MRSAESGGRLLRWAGAAAAVVVALGVVRFATAANPGGIDDLRARGEDAAEATAGKQAGTTCVGWPVALAPSGRPADAAGALVVWGDRAAFHVRNPGQAPVLVEVRVDGGKPRAVDGVTTEADDHHLVFHVPGDGEVSFTASCATTSMTFEALGDDVDRFAFGDGVRSNPVVLDKQLAS